MEEIVYQVTTGQKPIEITKQRPAIIFHSPRPENKWLIEINEDGIKFNHEEFPNATADDFAKTFVDILETQYALSIGKRLEKKMIKWEETEESKPKDGMRVLCWNNFMGKHEEPFVCRYHKDTDSFFEIKYGDEDSYPITVDYWFPLPQERSPNITYLWDL